MKISKTRKREIIAEKKKDKFIDSTIDHFNINVMAALLLPLEKRKDKLTLFPLAELKVK